MKLNYTKDEVKRIKEQLYLTEDEEEILEYWMLDYSNTKIADLVKLSTRTISRRKNSILEKINKIKTL